MAASTSTKVVDSIGKASAKPEGPKAMSRKDRVLLLTKALDAAKTSEARAEVLEAILDLKES